MTAAETQDELSKVMQEQLDSCSIAQCLQVKQALDLYISERKVAALFRKPETKETTK